MKTRRFNVTLPENVLVRLELLSRTNNVSMSSIIKIAISEYLRKNSEDDKTLKLIQSERNMNNE